MLLKNWIGYQVRNAKLSKGMSKIHLKITTEKK